MLAIKIILCIGLAFLILTLFLVFFQKHLVFHPSKNFDTIPSDIFEFEDVFFYTKDNIKINAWFIPAKGAKKTILFCHGNAGNISHRIFSITQFHKLGCNVLIFDYRGYGKSEGRISEEGSYLDGEAAYDFLISRGFSERDIILFGRSLGGAVAAKIAKSRSPFALILESTFTSIPDMGAKIYPFLPVRAFCFIKYDTLKIIADIKCPILIVHSPDDEIVPYEMGQKLFNSANTPKRFLKISGSHNEGYFISAPEYEEGLRDFIFNFCGKLCGK
ncbi:MAG TPA: alpha/beta hydrolase [Victivallales bacterium]|nr:alpha/beta hydrolase [Victivallales bacterium]